MNMNLEDEEIMDESQHECSLCLKLLFDPIKTSCNHTFCRFCLERYFRSRRHMEKKCPLCRHVLEPSVDVISDDALHRTLEVAFPAAYQTRKVETEEEEQRLRERQLHSKKLYVGNRHERTRDDTARGNIHRWTFFVHLDDTEDETEFIDRVVIRLHPTFTPSTLTMRTPPYAVTRLGWGIFTIQARIMFKSKWNKEPMDVSWMLDFSGNGNFEEHEVEFELPANQQTAENNPNAVQA
eukprot:GILK01004171.1.p1 GENE.GILK01004171.1~~GILK01004171.1.p1  ORF type:complete len:238 (-),score=30.03 GILK01004171.1:244-957(-)